MKHKSKILAVWCRGLFARKSLIAFLVVVALFVPGLSGAGISFQSSSSAGFNLDGVLGNLPPPLNDFINSARGINAALNEEIGKYISTMPIPNAVNVNLNQLNQFDLTQLLKSALENSFISGIYSAFIKILHFVGNLMIWILGLASDLIRQGLSVLR